MFCSRCGAQMSDGAKFCPQCGHGVSTNARCDSTAAQGETNPEPQAASQRPSAPEAWDKSQPQTKSQLTTADQSDPQQHTPKSSKLRKRKTLIAAAVAIAAFVVAVIALAVFVVLPKLGGISGGTASSGDEQNSEWQEAYEEYESVTSDVIAIEADYSDSNGYVKSSRLEELLDAVESFAQDNSEIESCSRDGECLTMSLASGITFIYVAPLEGTMAGDTNASIITLEPWWTDVEGVDSMRHELSESDKNDSEILSGWDDTSFIDECSYYVAGKLEGYSFVQSDEKNDSEVDIQELKSLHADEMVIYYGHGAYSSSLGSVLSTGIKDSWSNLKEYWGDIASNRLVSCGNGLGKRLGVTSSFFDYYYGSGSLAGCKIFLLSCHSLQDSKLAQSLVGKGTDIVVGFDEAVNISYAERMYYSMIGVEDEVGLTDRSSGGQLYTFEEALSLAKKKWGDSDPYSFEGKTTPAKCVCYPSDAASKTRLGDDTVNQPVTDESEDNTAQSESDSTPNALYAQKVRELLAESGNPDILKEHPYVTPDVLRGLCFADLLDFDGDGSDELLVAYEPHPESGNAEHGSHTPLYTVEVWKAQGSDLEMLIQTDYGRGTHFTDGGMQSLSVGRYDGRMCILSGQSDSFADCKVWTTDSQGDAVCHTLECEDAAESSCYVDGSEVSDEEFWNDLFLNAAGSEFRYPLTGTEYMGSGYWSSGNTALDVLFSTLSELGISDVPDPRD